MADAIRQSRVVLGETGLPSVVAANSNVPSAGIAMLGGDAKPYLFNFPGPSAQHSGAGKGGSRTRTVQHPHRARRHRPAGADGDGGAGRDAAVADLRDASGSDRQQHHSHQDRMRPASRASPSRALKCRPTATASSGSISRRMTWRAIVSAVDVLEGRVPADRISRRLVLIGTSAAGLLDIKTTPIDPAMPGVEINAAGARKHPHPVDAVVSRTTPLVVELAAALVLGLVIIWLAPILGPLLLLALGAAVVAVLVGASWYFFTQHRLLLDFTFPLLSSSADLPDAGIHQFRQRTGQAPADPFGVRPISVADAGRTTGAISRRSWCSAASSAT